VCILFCFLLRPRQPRLQLDSLPAHACRVSCDPFYLLLSLREIPCSLHFDASSASFWRSKSRLTRSYIPLSFEDRKDYCCCLVLVATLDGRGFAEGSPFLIPLFGRFDSKEVFCSRRPLVTCARPHCADPPIRRGWWLFLSQTFLDVRGDGTVVSEPPPIAPGLR